MIGQTKYYLDFKAKKVSSGVVFAEQITQSGYDIYLIKKDDGNITQIECCNAFDSEEDAMDAFNIKMPIANEMDKLNNEAKKKLDALRIKLIGKPQFKHLLGGKL